MRRAARRDLAEPDIVLALLKAGALVEYLDYPVDLLVRFQGKNYLLEVKTPGASRSKTMQARQKAQTEFCRLWCVPIVHNPAEALYAIGA